MLNGGENGKLVGILKAVLLWLGINGAISLALTLIRLQIEKGVGLDRYLLTFFLEYLNFLVISGLCLVTGRRFFALFPGIPYKIRLLITLPPVLITAMIGIVIIYGILYLLGILSLVEHDSRSFSEVFVAAIPLVVVITIIATIIATRMEYLSSMNQPVSKEEEKSDATPAPRSNTEKSGGQALTIRVEEDYIPVSYAKIIYLSAHGGSTVIHTLDGEHVVNRILKELEEKLPDDHFTRIHKSFVVNLKYIEKIQYYASGSYILYIKDEEESTLPVGRKYAARLKKRLSF